MEYVISVLVKNKVGVLSQIANLFAEYSMNITSISAGEAEDPTCVRITIAAEGDSSVGADALKKLETLSDVKKVICCLNNRRIARELAFIKIKIKKENRHEIVKIINTFQTRIVDLTKDFMVIEVVESEKGIDNLLELLRKYDIIEVVRSGQIALSL